MKLNSEKLLLEISSAEKSCLEIKISCQVQISFNWFNFDLKDVPKNQFFLKINPSTNQADS